MPCKKFHYFRAKDVIRLEIVVTYIRDSNLLRIFGVFSESISTILRNNLGPSSPFTRRVGIVVICLTSSMVKDVDVAPPVPPPLPLLNLRKNSNNKEINYQQREAWLNTNNN